jgi:exodeoxyribonuclease VIII
MKRVMIDFETLGNGKNACIVQVGACYFIDGNIVSKMKINFDVESCVKHGAELDASTVCWWLEQSEAARKSILERPRALEYEALISINEYLMGAEEIWSHATFDFVILMEALKRRGIKPSFSYRVARDIRTLNALCPSFDKNSIVREGAHHDGLDDAIYQAKYVMAMLGILGIK